MIEAKKGKVSLYVHNTKMVGDVAVCLCIDLSANGCCLNRLQCGWNCDSHPSDEEVTCVAYSMWLNVNNLLCGDPLAVKASKVGSTKCGAHNGRFFISWKTKGTLSGARKSVGLALKGLTPGKLYSTYSQVVRSIGSTPNRANFNWAAQEVLSAINKGVCVGVVGRINLGKTLALQKEKLEAMVNVVAKKLNPGDVKTPKIKPDVHSACDHTGSSIVKVSGWAAYVVKDYIMAKERGLVPLVCNKMLIIPAKESSWKSKSDKLKKNASSYVMARYAKVGSELGSVMAYLAMANGIVSCHDVKPLLRGAMTAAQVTAVIKDAL
jgi:hypothetical protein